MISDDLIKGLDPVSFARGTLHFEPDEWQVRVLRSPCKRLLLNCCRQSGKSTIAAILALHRALYYPESLVLVVSPSFRQSSELFRKILGFLVNVIDGSKTTEDNQQSVTFENGSRIVSLPSSEATIRGFSGAILIIEDESARVDDDLYRAIRPMLAVSHGRLILMSTPFGKRGHFHDAWVNGGEVWERIEVPASICPRIKKAFLDEERRALGDLWFRQEYCCEFTETRNQVFSYDLVKAAVSSELEPLIFKED